MARMKTSIVAWLLGVAVLATGCVSTVSGTSQAGVPFVKDKIEARYERPPDEIFRAAKEVIAFNGTLVAEKTLHNQPNVPDGIARVAEGKVNKRTVMVRVQQMDARVTAVTVQTRTSGGGADVELASEIDKQIALKLAR
jgi:hypothetical protein